jgi:hypothetical protein
MKKKVKKKRNDKWVMKRTNRKKREERNTFIYVQGAV